MRLELPIYLLRYPQKLSVFHRREFLVKRPLSHLTQVHTPPNPTIVQPWTLIDISKKTFSHFIYHSSAPCILMTSCAYRTYQYGNWPRKLEAVIATKLSQTIETRTCDAIALNASKPNSAAFEISEADCTMKTPTRFYKASIDVPQFGYHRSEAVVSLN